MTTKTIFNNYGNFFQNGTYSNGNPVLYKLVHFEINDGDDFAIFQQLNSDTFCVGHLINFDFDSFKVSWSWGHYDFKTIESAKKFIKNFFNK